MEPRKSNLNNEPNNFVGVSDHTTEISLKISKEPEISSNSPILIGHKKPLFSSYSVDSFHKLPTRSKLQANFESSRRSWVFTKAPPAPEALTSTSAPAFTSFDKRSENDQFSMENIGNKQYISDEKKEGRIQLGIVVKGMDEVNRDNNSPKTPSRLREVTLPVSQKHEEDLHTKHELPHTNLAIVKPVTNEPHLEPAASLSDSTMLPSLSSSPTSTVGPGKESQRTSLVGSNRDSFGSDMGYFSTSPGSDLCGKSTVHDLTRRGIPVTTERTTFARLSDVLYQPISPTQQHQNVIFPNRYSHIENCTEDGFATARSSFYLTPPKLSPSTSYLDLNSQVTVELTTGSVYHTPLTSTQASMDLNGGSVYHTPSTSKISLIDLDLSPQIQLKENVKSNDKLILSPICESVSELKSDSQTSVQYSPQLQQHQPILDPQATPKLSDNVLFSPHPITPNPDLLRRHHIANEILYTERTYVKGLELIEKVFYQPLMEASKSDNPILDTKQINDIFSNLMGILAVNKEFLSQLEARLEGDVPWSPEKGLIGDIFCHMAPYFRMYSLYVKNFNSALSIISDQMGRSLTFATFLKDKNVLLECKGLPFESYLILPVQRIPRYKMLIEDLLKRTDNDHADHNNLVKGLDIVQKVATFVNEQIRQHEMFMEMLTIQKSLQGYNEVLLVPGRKLIKHGAIWKICRKNHQQRMFFLFSDILIYASGSSLEGPLVFHRKVDLELVKVVDVEDSLIIQNGFQVISPDKSFAAYCDTFKEKKSWVSAISNTIIELHTSKRTLKLNPHHANSLNGKVKPNIILPQVISNYSAPVWIPDDQATHCHACKEEFTVFKRKHHCRLCGEVVCHTCSNNTFYIPGHTVSDHRPARSCDPCYKIHFKPPTNLTNNLSAIRRLSLLGTVSSYSSQSSSESSDKVIQRFPFGAPKRLAQLKDSFISRESYYSDSSSVNSFWNDDDSNTKVGSRSSEDRNSNVSRLQRMSSVSSSTAALINGFSSFAKYCELCLCEFTVFKWKNQCQICSKIVCSDCLSKKPNPKRQSTPLPPTKVVDLGEDIVKCDPCYLGILPEHVILNPEGGGWGVQEGSALETSPTPAQLVIKEANLSNQLTDEPLSESPTEIQNDMIEIQPIQA